MFKRAIKVFFVSLLTQGFQLNHPFSSCGIGLSGVCRCYFFQVLKYREEAVLENCKTRWKRDEKRVPPSNT